jgi:hypothetical protein
MKQIHFVKMPNFFLLQKHDSFYFLRLPFYLDPDKVNADPKTPQQNVKDGGKKPVEFFTNCPTPRSK